MLSPIISRKWTLMDMYKMPEVIKGIVSFYTAPPCQLHTKMHINKSFLQVIQSLRDSMEHPPSANLKKNPIR